MLNGRIFVQKSANQLKQKEVKVVTLDTDIKSDLLIFQGSWGLLQFLSYSNFGISSLLLLKKWSTNDPTHGCTGWINWKQNYRMAHPFTLNSGSTLDYPAKLEKIENGCTKRGSIFQCVTMPPNHLLFQQRWLVLKFLHDHLCKHKLIWGAGRSNTYIG